MNTKKFVHLDGEGKAWGIVSAEQLWANVYALKNNRPETKLDREIWKKLFNDAKVAAINFGAETIVARLRQDYEIEKLQSVLTETGLKRISKRIKYQCDVENLPNEAGSPISWKTAKELDWSFKKIAEFTELIIKDALDIEPEEKAVDFIQDWVHRHGFSMMKNQGGKLYHGGTHADNLAMKKLFEIHGCKVFCEMEEWSLSVKGGI